MKVEKEMIVLDDEVVDLNNVTIIDIVKTGFESSQFCLNIGYVGGTNRTIDVSVSNDRFKVLKRLNMLSEEIQFVNDNFANIGFALLNMDNIDSVDYNQDKGTIEVISKGFISSFKASKNQAERTITRYYDAYDQYVRNNQFSK